MTTRSVIVDAVLNLHTTEAVALRPSWHHDFLGNKIGMSAGERKGLSLAALVDKLDEAGIAKAIVPAVKCGSVGPATNYHLPYEMVADAVQRYPDRFVGIAGLDPTEGMRGVRALERAVRDDGFVGAHLYPHWFELAPDHAKYYPFYAKCVELEVPIQMQVGHALRYSADRPLRNVGHPMTLDVIACDFPELKLVGIHIGWPWTEEMIAVAYKHPNVYIGSDAYAPKHWPETFVRYIDSWGQDKVLFGTDYPVIDPVRALTEIDELKIRPGSKEKFLWKNANALYRLGLDEASAEVGR